MNARPPSRRGSSLVETLVVIAALGVLASLILPALAPARGAAQGAQCASNLRQLGVAWTLYAADFDDRAMPLAYWDLADIGSGEQVFWWGTHGESGYVDHDRGFIAPYLDARPGRRSVFECPVQPWGSYIPQGPAQAPTSTYGYNGYYLSPGKTPGWGLGIGHRPWRRLAEIERPTLLFVFADALLPVAGGRNSALLDPPALFGAGAWKANPFPTTAFRHARGGGGAGAAVSVRADGSAHAIRARPHWLTDAALGVGSAGVENDPHYVPDWRTW
jgi:competence protein ComGC